MEKLDREAPLGELDQAILNTDFAELYSEVGHKFEDYLLSKGVNLETILEAANTKRSEKEE